MKASVYLNRLNYITSISSNLVLIIIILLTSSCGKSYIEPRSVYDKNLFFTVNINGKSYTTYAWYYRYRPLVRAEPYIEGVYAVRMDSTRMLPWSLHFVVTPDMLDDHLQVPGTCAADVALKKTGVILGAYSIDGSKVNVFSGIDGRSYLIDSTDAVFNLTYFSPPGTAIPVVEGNFQCTCYNQSNNVSFAATGSFRLMAR